MLKTVRNAFKVEDIRKRLLYTLLMLVVVRFGSQLPTPGVDPTFIQNFFAQQTGDAFNFFEAFTGGSFTRMSVFALSITPYITSSIIMQLLTIAIPKLEEMQKERFVFDWCAQQIDYLRIDTHENNRPMQAAVLRYGFQPCGVVQVRGGARLAFDYEVRA